MVHMINFPHTTSKGYSPDNIAEDMQEFIESKTGLIVGYEIEGDYIQFLGWYDCKEFSVAVGGNEKLKNIQKQIHDYCKAWNKREENQKEKK